MRSLFSFDTLEVGSNALSLGMIAYLFLLVKMCMFALKDRDVGCSVLLGL